MNLKSNKENLAEITLLLPNADHDKYISDMPDAPANKSKKIVLPFKLPS